MQPGSPQHIIIVSSGRRALSTFRSEEIMVTAGAGGIGSIRQGIRCWKG